MYVCYTCYLPLFTACGVAYAYYRRTGRARSIDSLFLSRAFCAPSAVRGQSISHHMTGDAPERRLASVTKTQHDKSLFQPHLIPVMHELVQLPTRPCIIAILTGYIPGRRVRCEGISARSGNTRIINVLRFAARQSSSWFVQFSNKRRRR